MSIRKDALKSNFIRRMAKVTRPNDVRGDVTDKDYLGIPRVGWQEDSCYMGGLREMLKYISNFFLVT